MLRVRDIHVSYGRDFRVLNGASLDVHQGSITALLGANGAGKSTTLKAISGILGSENGWISRGFVELDGSPVHGLDPVAMVKRGLLHVMEGRRIFPELTVHENLVAASYLKSNGASLSLGFDTAYSFFPILRERRRQLAGYLSGGEQQMLVIARALVMEPRMLLLDEPSLGLAPMVVREIYGLVRKLRDEAGMTILIVEQRITLALSVADFAYVMENGKIVAAGQPDALSTCARVRGFVLGSNSDTGVPSND